MEHQRYLKSIFCDNITFELNYLKFYFCSYLYPTIDELAAQLLFVLSHFGLKSVIGFGVGAGANILSRFALNNPDKVSLYIFLNNCIKLNNIKMYRLVPYALSTVYQHHPVGLNGAIKVLMPVIYVQRV